VKVYGVVSLWAVIVSSCTRCAELPGMSRVALE
jgi:hypothetical protein